MNRTKRTLAMAFSAGLPTNSVCVWYKLRISRTRNYRIYPCDHWVHQSTMKTMASLTSGICLYPLIYFTVLRTRWKDARGRIVPEGKTEPIFKLGRFHGSPSDKSIVIPHKLLFNLVPRALLFSGPGSSRRLGTRLTAIINLVSFMLIIADCTTVPG